MLLALNVVLVCAQSNSTLTQEVLMNSLADVLKNRLFVQPNHETGARRKAGFGCIGTCYSVGVETGRAFEWGTA